MKPCFKKIELDREYSFKVFKCICKKIHIKKNLNLLKNLLKITIKIDINENKKIAIITPDKDIIPDAQTLSPAYIVFENYEIILKWNRSLRFALSSVYFKR